MGTELCSDFFPETRFCSRAHDRVWSWGCGGCGVRGSNGEQETVHTTEKLDRLSAEWAAGLWRPALLWDPERRMEECGRRHKRLRRGFLCVFPVCLMWSSGPGPVSCVWWVPGPGPRHKDSTPQETTNVSNRPGSRYTHQDSFTGFYIHTHTHRLRASKFTRQSSWEAELLDSFLCTQGPMFLSFVHRVLCVQGSMSTCSFLWQGSRSPGPASRAIGLGFWPHTVGWLLCGNRR